MCSVTYFGEGAANQGQVYETFNMAALWKLPVIFVIENNRYAMGTVVTRSAANSEELYNRGSVFGIPGEQVDGMDVRAVKAAADKAVAHCRAGGGPYILEMMTYRYRGHSMSDPAKYRAKEEVQKMREESDPIEQVKSRLIESEVASEDELKKIDAEIRAIVTRGGRVRPVRSRARSFRIVDRCLCDGVRWGAQVSSHVVMFGAALAAFIAWAIAVLSAVNVVNTGSQGREVRTPLSSSCRLAFCGPRSLSSGASCRCPISYAIGTALLVFLAVIGAIASAVLHHPLSS